MHSTASRDHHDMLQICCDICGVKKNPQLVTKISFLEKIKSFLGDANYDITDKRFPKERGRENQVKHRCRV